MSYECCGEICLNLFRQHHDDFVHQKTWGYYFSKIIKSFRVNIVTLSQNRYPTPNDVCPYIPQSCRCAKQTNCTSGMGHFKVNIQPNNLELVSRQESNRPQCTIAQLDSLEQPVLLSTVESDSSSTTEDPQRETNSNTDNANVDICNMVSRSDKVNDRSADIVACNSNNPGSKKRQITTIRQQEMVSSNMETQRNSTIQQGFINWLAQNGSANNYTTIDLINYLAQIYTLKKLSINTLKAYKSAICQMFIDNSKEIDTLMIKSFFKSIEEMSIKSFVEFKIDILPIVSYFQRLGPTNLLSLKDLTEKTCWLLAVCGFMRASDMHRIDDVRTTLSDTSVCFVIFAPKEKRQGRPIERPCKIKAHNNKLMCPVDAYRIHKQKVANVPCTSPHVSNNNITINHLFRYIKDNSKPLSVDSISINIKSITKLIVTNGKQIPKARAIGATLAQMLEYRQT
ncbi:hypothetical protein BB561_000653 [Smittium simulii]|uniref:Uncharacterized protein n=1 Tax=Smittium simulii TaxID=133385 RepID=A0A2T9YY74_9FUNG|nr:hypothetical protein BB561_000653 [Smittium simulii]